LAGSERGSIRSEQRDPDEDIVGVPFFGEVGDTPLPGMATAGEEGESREEAG
jgi:hypothetical protein